MSQTVIIPDKSNCIIRIGARGKFPWPSQFPGFAKEKTGTRDIIFRPTANNIKYINQHWPDAEWIDGTVEHLDRFIEEQKEAAISSDNKQVILEDDGSYEYKTAPFDHQRQLFLLSRDREVFAYFMEQGTGKSKPIIDTAAYLYSQGKIQALIIIADNGVHSNWIEEEIPIHMPDWCPHKMWTYSSNMTKGREKDFEEVAANDNVLRIFAFNVEGFTSEKAKRKLENIIDIRNLKAMVVIDESESIKNATTKRSKYLTRACRNVEYKRILTGTPVTQGIEDLYSQCLWLGDQVLGYDSFWTFRGQFCTMGGYEMKKIVGYKNIDELVSLLDGYSFRVLKKECLDLPEKIYKRWPVELTPRQRTMYNDIKNKYWTELEGHGTIEADLAIVRLLRLQQITCGWFPNDDMVAIPGDNPKLEATRQYVSSVNTPALIWCRFKKDIKNITEELRRDHGKDVIASYFGETPTEDRTQHVKNFQAGHYKAMVCSSAASRGLTLTASSNSFYHSNGNKYGDRIQSEDRNHRIGTKNNVVYTDCVAKNTIDNQFIRAFKRKKNVSDMVTQDPESFFLEEAA